MLRVEGQGRLERVVVYATGAVVTRRVEVADWPREAFELAVPGLPLAARPGSLSATAPGRDLLSATSRIELSADTFARAADPRRLAEVEERLRAALALRDRWLVRAAGLADVGPRASIFKAGSPRARAEALTAVLGFVDELSGELAARERALDLEIERLGDEQRRLTIAVGERAAPRRLPTRVALLAFAPGERPSELTLEYVVDLARWWTAYSVHLSDRGRRAELRIEAHVAQATGEDWSDLALAVATADLETGVTLPELPALRLGKPRPKRRSGYRPLPSDLEELFAGFDASGVPPSLADGGPPAFEAEGSTGATPLPSDFQVELGADADEVLSAVVGGAAPPPSMSYELDEVLSAPMAPSAAMAAAPKGGGGLERAKKRARPPAAPPRPRPVAPPPSDEPEDAWLDFDRLILGGPGAPGDRGRLRLGPRDVGPPAAELLAPPGALEPAAHKGEFDYVFEAALPTSVPASPKPTRVLLARAPLPARSRFSCLPRESLEVFRELELASELPYPLLGGRLDVYSDGALLTATSFGRVDRGGVLRFSLGVEERIRVARNARVEEATVGMLSGTTQVTHAIEVQLESLLGFDVVVDVYERIPVSDEKGLEVELGEASIRPTKWDQADRGPTLRGGLHFAVPLGPGAKRTLTYNYRIRLPAKQELVGGNRRE